MSHRIDSQPSNETQPDCSSTKKTENSGSRGLEQRKLRQAQEQLNLERERLTLALKVGKACTFDWNIRDNINVWSRESEELYGFARGESGSTYEDWESCVLRDDLSHAKAAIGKSFETGELASEWRIKRRHDGEIRWMHVRAKVFYDNTGRPTRMIGINVDITERKKAEEQLRRSETRSRSIIESAPYGIFRVDQSGRIVMANPALATMLGYETPQEVLALNTAKDVYLNPEGQQRARDYATEDPVVGHETKWKKKDGRTITVRLGGRRLPDDDELPGGFEVFVEDITEQRSLQKQLEHAQKMEAVGRLAGGVAHDFNNLLMVISGYAQLLEELKAKDEKVSRYVTQIREASCRAANVTRQLLAFSRKQVLEPTFLSLNSVTKDLCKMLPRLLGEDIEIITNLDRDLGTVRADRGQIEQVIMNLAVNARDAMPKGGRLTLETANVALDTAYHQRREISVPPGRYVLIAVSDTGVGMDADTQLHIFEPFFTTKENGHGTGLGLATVYGIVKQSQGFIWVYSELGKGSTFKIYLPRLDNAPTEQNIPSIEVTPGGTETILLAEDESALRHVGRVYLQSKGYTVLEAADANEALDICRNYQSPIHMLITDMVMPGMGGLELAKAAMNLRAGVAVVLVSGYTDRGLDTNAVSIGALFLQKPFSLDALARTVRLSLNKGRTILLIDDSQFMRVAIERILTPAGYTVKTARDGEEGLQMARETQPDAVLLDMVLPTTPGSEVLRSLKQDRATTNIPIIVLTVRSEGEKERLLAEGAAAYLEKSDKLLEHDAAALIEAVGRILARTAREHS